MTILLVGEAAARLNGFLYAASSLSGTLREYENLSFYMNTEGDTRETGQLINEYYEGLHKFSFDVTEVADRPAQLEFRLRPYLVRDRSCIVTERVEEIQKYFSFRIMDMISEVFTDDQSERELIEMHDRISTPTDEFTFFCLRSRRLLLVLQFNWYKRL